MFDTELWMQLFRNIPHCNQETTGGLEAYHRVLKASTHFIQWRLTILGSGPTSTPDTNIYTLIKTEIQIE